MRIKEADDKTKRITLLESLQASPVLDASQKKWLEKELWAVKEGVRGERDAAHYLDNHFASSENSALIHDLRLEVDGEVAQIDHLLISRDLFFTSLKPSSTTETCISTSSVSFPFPMEVENRGGLRLL